MSQPSETKVIAALMKKHGRTFSSELGIKMERATSSALFRWLCASLLFSARISNEIATEAARDQERMDDRAKCKALGQSFNHLLILLR
jgi:hypothetical protein